MDENAAYDYDNMVFVCKQDYDNYRRIVSALGTVEAGDPVAEVERLKRTLGAYQKAYPALRERASELESVLNKIAERTGSDDPCRWMVDLARSALRYERVIDRAKLPKE